MCVPLQNRTLQGGHHDKIYSFFEDNDICKYLDDVDFKALIGTLNRYRGTTNDDEILEFVDLVNGFIGVSGWNSLQKIGRGRFLELCNQLHILDGEDEDDRPKASYHQLCFHFGQIGFDYIELNE